MASLRSYIKGTGAALPEKIVTNEDISKLVETSDKWISTRTGIKERRVITNENAASLASSAGKEALANAGLSPKDIDLVICATVTSDMPFPSTACCVQRDLGINPGVPAFDVAAACSGFIFVMDIADKYIKSGTAKNVLIIGVDLFSRILDWTDRATCVIFGDGAGAAVLSATDEDRGVLASRIHSDGNHWKNLYCPTKFETPFLGHIEEDSPYVKMQGNETFKVAVRTMEENCQEALIDAGLTKDDINLVIPHQANIRIINAIRDRLELNDEQVYSNIENYGNTSAASIPIALHEARKEGRVKAGDIVVFVAFGGGLTWASSVVKF